MNKTLILRISRIVLLLLVFFFIFAVFNAKIWDPDLWWHLKTGEYIAQTKEIPSTDPFAFTSLPKDPIHPESKRIKFILSQYWIAQLIFYWVYKMFSLQGIIYMRALILTLLMLLLYKGIRREGSGFFQALIFLFPAVVIFFNFTGERPQLFSFLFTFLLVFLLEGFRRAAKTNRDSVETDTSLNKSQRVSGLSYLFPIPLIVLLWSNMHGGVILGIILILGYAVCETVKYLTKKLGEPLPYRSFAYLIAASVAATLLSLVNPNGYNVVPFLIELNKSQYMTSIVEAKSPLVFIQYGYYTQELYVFFFLLIAGFLTLLINIKRADLTDAVIFSGLAALSLSAARIIPFFTPVAVLILARYWTRNVQTWKSSTLVARIRERTAKIRSIAGSAFSESLLAAGCSVLIIVMLNNGAYFQSGVRKGRYPEGAVKFLKENKIHGNMYNPYVWGGYMLWSLYPEYKVFIDGRGLIEEVFFQSDKIMGASSLQFAGAPEWKAILDAYKVTFIVTFSVADFTGKLVPLIPALYYDPEWHLVYMDNYSLIFVRDTTENRETIEKFGMPKDWVWNEVLTEAAKKVGDFRGNANYYITMGDALLARENYRAALTAYLKAREIAPGSGIIRDKLNMLQNAGTH
ncbi:MAG: hypothetical protein AB1442_12210 [Nitrospirota bacterium]